MRLSFKTTLDRIENKTAVLLVRPEEDKRISVPFSLLPEGSKEGDILDIDIRIDEKETELAKERVKLLRDKIMSRK